MAIVTSRSKSLHTFGPVFEGKEHRAMKVHYTLLATAIALAGSIGVAGARRDQ